MFEEGMSSNELLDEYRLDLADIQEKTVRFDNSEYVTRYLWKRHKQPTVILTKVFTSFRGNNYLGILIYFQSGAGKSKKWDWSSFHIGLMNTGKGISAIAFILRADKLSNSILISFIAIRSDLWRFVTGRPRGSS